MSVVRRMAAPARTGAGGLVVSDVDLRVRERECSCNDEQRDRVVETTSLGTAIAEFRTTHRPPSSLTIMR
jgi:hypothetical protein